MENPVVGPAFEVVDPVLFAATLTSERAADIVEILSDEPAEAVAAILERLPPALAVDVLDQPELARAGEIVSLIAPERAAQLLTGMSADRATAALRQLDPDEQRRLLARLDRDTAASLRALVAYPPGTAGSMMTTEFVAMPATATVGQTLDHIRQVERTRETVYAIYLLDPRTHALRQTVSLRRLIMGAPGDAVLLLAPEHEPIAVTPETDREEVARLITKHNLLAIPVVDAGRRMLGIVTVDDVIDAIMVESAEDVQKFGGVAAVEEPYLQVGFLDMIRMRAGWLCVLFLGEMLTASAMQHFESELEKAIVLTLFIPLIMSSGGNSGSQATSLLIRALALGELRLRDWWRVLVREVPMGITLGAILGLMGMTRITLWQLLGLHDYGEHWILVALTVGTGLVGIVGFGTLAGSMLPFILKRLRFDPASASAPFVATLVDVTGLVIYFSVALMILSGTLL